MGGNVTPEQGTGVDLCCLPCWEDWSPEWALGVNTVLWESQLQCFRVTGAAGS